MATSLSRTAGQNNPPKASYPAPKAAVRTARRTDLPANLRESFPMITRCDRAKWHKDRGYSGLVRKLQVGQPHGESR